VNANITNKDVIYYQREINQAVKDYVSILRDGEVEGLDELWKKIVYCFYRLGY
jgi:hypothetical protein